MTSETKTSSHELLLKEFEKLTEIEKKVIVSMVKKRSSVRNINQEVDHKLTLGEKIADKVAAFGGSWTFIIIFGATLIGWIIVNSFVLLARAFDPYPYILLNLFLSMIAALQAPVIMMSQNRQAARDRLDAAHDYEVNLKAELEIRYLHEKLDNLREQKWTELVEFQQQQIQLLENLLHDKSQNK